jgi:DNA primase
MIDFDIFLQWCEEKFPGEVVVHGDEIQLNSIFIEDRNHHLWCSPSGGKHKRPNGVYRCFKTDKQGTLIGLVKIVENCSGKEAHEILSGQTSVHIMEEELDRFFANKEAKPEPPKQDLRLPDYAVRVEDLNAFDRKIVEDYLGKRKIPIDGFYYCCAGRQIGRIVVPYYDRAGKLIYWNARHTNKDINPKYRGPDKNCGTGKGDILYAYRWPEKGSKIYLCEGEFNSISLIICGLPSLACGGKNLTDKHLQIIKNNNYSICLGLDNDERIVEYASPGFQGMVAMAKTLMGAFVPTSYVFPPKGLKDWNDMLVAFKPELVAEYIKIQEKTLDPLKLEQLLCLV